MKNLMRVILILTVLTAVQGFGCIYAYEYKGIDIRGFVSQGYLQSSDNNFFAETEDGTTQFNEAGINFSADVSDKLRLGMQFLARDLGSIGNNEVILDWAVADYHWKDPLGFRVGNMKFVHGLYNETRDLDMLRTFIFLPQSVYNEAWRESSSSIQGVGFYGDVPLSDMGSLNYDVQYGTINISDDKGAARLLEDQWPFKAVGLSIDVDNIDVERTYAASVKWITNMEGLVLGTSTYGYSFESESTTMLNSATVVTVGNTIRDQGIALSNNDLRDRGIALANMGAGLNTFGTQLTVPKSSFDADATVYTASMEFTWRNLVFAAEYMRTTYELELQNDLFSATGVFNPALVAAGVDVAADGTVKIDKFTSEGYYGSVAYRFTPWLELGTYYSVYYANKSDKSGSERVAKGLDTEKYRAWLKDWCLTTRFDVTENWIFKIEGHKMNGAAILLGADNPPVPTGEDRYKEDWYLYAAKVSYNF